MPIPLRADFDAARLRGQRARVRMPGRLGGCSRWPRSMMGQAAPRRPGSAA